METTPATRPQLRVYPLDPQRLTQEQIAVTFAMTSRNAAPFDEIQKAVTEAKAADFHERWVLNYGHASVAEHAVIHMAVENLSRLACDELEDNRLASYTEKSSRYQVLDRGSYHVPSELRGHPLEQDYVRTCDHLFDVYHDMIVRTVGYLRRNEPRKDAEKEAAYQLRLRREATDHCRFLLPASTLTNVGITMNARSMEHAITKLLSSDLDECKELGTALKAQGRRTVPTLVKYAERSEYLTETQKNQWSAALGKRKEQWAAAAGQQGTLFRLSGSRKVRAKLLDYDRDAEQRLAASMLFRVSGLPYSEVTDKVRKMSQAKRSEVIQTSLRLLGPFDPPVRELETLGYLFDLEMDYGAYREYKRHRMQTYLPQQLTAREGYVIPGRVVQAGGKRDFVKAMDLVAETYERLLQVSPSVASYVVTHAHVRRVLVNINLRECYHLLKLRTAPQAHFTMQKLARQMLRELKRVHPLLVKYVQRRD